MLIITLRLSPCVPLFVLVVLFTSLPIRAAEVTVLPAPATEVVTAIGNLPTYNNRDDGLGVTSDRLDMTFTATIDFLEKTAGTREVIWETGGGTIGSSVVYEAPSTIVYRSNGNGGFSLLTLQYALSAGEIAAGDLELGWTYDVSNASGLQQLSLIVNGQIVATDELDIGGDWSGSDAAKFGNAGAVAGSGANSTIPAVAFTSGTINLVDGLAFFADTLWLPIAADSDTDGLPDAWEETYFPGDLTALASGQDNDADGLDDEDEFALRTDPTDPDSDDDALSDGREANPAELDFTATDPLSADSDADGRPDGEEVGTVPLTDPNERDSDGDRFIDGLEITAGSDPNLEASKPPIGGLLCSYWPLDSLDAGGVAVPDLAGGGLDLQAQNLDPSSVVPGRIGNAISFDAVEKTLLFRDSAAGEDLPISQHQDYTVAMWVKVAGAGQFNRRLFSEASRSNSSALLALGTHINGTDDSVEVMLRNLSGNNGGPRSSGMPLDGTWHHLAWVRYGESNELYIDGVLDSQSFDFFEPFVTDATTTTALGGVYRALPTHWVTGLIDDVSLWKVALPVSEIATLASGTAANQLVEDSDSDGMPDAWEDANGLDPGSAADAGVSEDADSLTNLQEYQRGTDPNLVDTDGDGLNDDIETNTGTWVSASDTGTSPRLADTDGDGLNDNAENPDLAYDADNPAGQPGSDPNDVDSDDDLVWDGAEVIAGTDPTTSASVPEPEAYFSWSADAEPLGTTYGADGVIATIGTNPPNGGLEAQGSIPVVAISTDGAEQTKFTQTLDFGGSSHFTITPEPNALRDMISVANVESSGTLEFYLSPDSLVGANQYVFESGGTGDGLGLVLIGSELHFGVNSGNNAPVGPAIATVDLAPLYGANFSADDYLLVRVNTEPLSHVALGVTHLRTGLSAVDTQPWTGNSWDGGDPLGVGYLQGGRGGDRDNRLSSLPGATTSWSNFDGQIAELSVYPGILPATIAVNTEVFSITEYSIDAAGMITLEWVSFPGEEYSIFSSKDLKDFSFEIADALRSQGARTRYTFQNQQPNEPRLFFRVAKQLPVE